MFERVRGWAGNTTGSVDPVEALDDVPEAGLENVRLAVDRRHDVAPRLVRDRVALAGSGREAHARVGHHVAHDVELAAHALGAQGLGRPLVRAEEVRGDRVDLDPRALLGHREVSAAHARLDVSERDAGCVDARPPASVEFVSP